MAKQIPLSGQNGEGKFAIVDDEDYAAVSVYSWHLHHNGYAKAKTNGSKLPMHRLIIGNSPADLVVDHIDGNRLNNQRANLRFATVAQNKQNAASHRDSTSCYKGVSWNTQRQLWVAQIQYEDTPLCLGFFASEIAAARAYNDAAAKYHGEFARLNIIPDEAIEPVRYRQAVPFVRGGTSKYRGVSFSPQGQRWRASIGANRKVINLGYFDTEEAAARAYDAAAKLHHGDRAFLNFPME